MATAKERQRDAALKEAQDIARKSDLTPEERTDLAARVELIDSLKADIERDAELRSAVAAMSPAEVEDQREEAAEKSLDFVTAFAKSDTVAWLKETGGHGNSPAFDFKSEPTVIDEATAGGSGLVVAQRRPGIEPLASYPLSVVDLIPSFQTDSASVSYVLEASETHTIAGAAEGAEKGNFTLTSGVTTEEVEVIAGMAALTRQMLSDVPFMASFVNQRMTYKLRQVEEDQILEGDGSSPNLDGIQHRTTSTYTQGAETVLDAIYKAADEAYVDGGYPSDAVVFHPTDWQPVRLSKDGNDRYYGDGPFGQILGDTIWGLRVVKSTQQTAGTALVGAFRQAAFIARNGGLTIRTSDSHSDYFKKNKVAVLIEERIALGVNAPLAFNEVTLTA